MSDFVPKPGTWTLFDNRESKTSDRAPDYKGELVWLDGTKLDLAIWLKHGKNGPFFSGTIQRPRPPEETPPPPVDDGDAPF